MVDYTTWKRGPLGVCATFLRRRALWKRGAGQFWPVTPTGVYYFRGVASHNALIKRPCPSGPAVPSALAGVCPS